MSEDPATTAPKPSLGLEPVKHFNDLPPKAKDLLCCVLSFDEYDKISEIDDDPEYWKRVATYSFGKKFPSIKKLHPSQREQAYRDKCKTLDPVFHKCGSCGFSVKIPSVVFYDTDLECLACNRISDHTSFVCDLDSHRFVLYSQDLYNPHLKRKIDRPVNYCKECGVLQYAPMDKKEQKKLNKQDRYRADSGVVIDKKYKEMLKSSKKRKTGDDNDDDDDASLFEDEKVEDSSEEEEDDEDEPPVCEACDEPMITDEGGLYYCPECAEGEGNDEEDGSEEGDEEEEEDEEEKMRKWKKKEKKKMLKKLMKKDKKKKKKKKSKSRDSAEEKPDKKRDHASLEEEKYPEAKKRRVRGSSESSSSE